MSGKIPVRIVTAGDGTTQPVGVDFGRNHNFEVVTAADQRSAGHIPMTAAVAAALGISVSGSGPILDTYTGASFAYSPRLIRTGTTFCMRVRVSSAGGINGSLYDVSATTAGISTATPVTFVSGTSGATTINDLLTTGGSNDLFIRVYYDQSGNARDLTQTTDALQPRIAAAGALTLLDTGLPVAPGNVSGRYMVRAATPVAEIAGSGTDFTSFTVCRFTSFVASQSVFGWGASTSNEQSFGTFAGSNTVYLDAPEVSARASGAFSATTAQQFSGFRSTTTATLRQNGSVLNSNASASGTLSGSADWGLFVSSFQFGVSPSFSGLIGEHIHYASKIADASIAAIEAEQKAFWGTP